MDPYLAPRSDRDRGHSTDARVLRERIAAHSRAIDNRAASARPFASARLLCQVYAGGSLPTAPNVFYLTHPVQVTGTVGEGAAGTFTADTNTTIPVLVLNGVPSVGDYLTAYSVGGRWVSEMKAPPGSSPFAFTVKGCAGLAYAGLTVSVYDSTGATLLDSGTTDGAGHVTLSFSPIPGTHVVTITGQSSRFDAYSQSLSLTGSALTITLTAASGYECVTAIGGCLQPFADTLYASWNFSGTIYTATGTFNVGLDDWVFPFGGLLGTYSLLRSTLQFENAPGGPTPTSRVCPTPLSMVWDFGPLPVSTLTITE